MGGTKEGIEDGFSPGLGLQIVIMGPSAAIEVAIVDDGIAFRDELESDGLIVFVDFGHGAARAASVIAAKVTLRGMRR